MNTMTPTVSSVACRVASGAVGVVGAVVAGAALTAPAYAAPVPEGPVATTHESRVAVDDQPRAGGVTAAGMSAQVTAKLQAMEGAVQDQQPASQTPPTSGSDSDPSSVPLILLTVLGGGLVTGAAGFTVYRFRHHGPIGAATA